MAVEIPIPPAATSPATAPATSPTAANSSAGMGRRVISGGAWTMLGEIARFVAALIATRLTTSILGTTAYGVWSQITRIGGSLSFADAGVGTASTKFVTEAFARGDAEGERRALWASLLVGLVPSLLVALLMLPIAPWLVHEFFPRTPPELRAPMVIGLQLSALAFVLRTVTAVFNSPLLARMRLGQNTLIFYGGVVAQILLVPVVLARGGIAWGASVAVFVWIVTGATYVWLTARLLPGALKPVLDRDRLRPIARMGVGTLGMALAAQALYSADAFIVGRACSTDEAAYYNIAFQASTMLSILPSAAAQALQPAFNRLLARDEHESLQALVRNAMRAFCLALPPIVALMCVAARPFFETWLHDPAYSLRATPVFWVMLAGLVLNALTIVPSTLLVALGRTGTTARVGLFELVPFVLYTWVLTDHFGIMGAAAGRTLRFIILCAVMFPLTARLSKLGFSPRLKLAPFALALACTAIPIGLALWPMAPRWAQAAGALGGVATYILIVRALILTPGEKDLAGRMLARLSGKFRRA